MTISDGTPLARVNGSRRQLQLKAGVIVICNGRTYRIESILGDLKKIVAVGNDDGRREILQITDLSLPPTDETRSLASVDLADVAPAMREKAFARMDAIAPLLQDAGRKAVTSRARELGSSTATLYRWLRWYRALGSTAALIPRTRGWQAGKSRLDPAVELVIDEIITTIYLTPQRIKVANVARLVVSECRKRRLAPPHYNAVARRIRAIPENVRLRARGQREIAEQKFRPTPGHFPGADYPLAVVQIDHTPLDIILVDEIERKPIGRPYLTLAIDVFSRMITGYYIALDAPSAMSAGMCAALSMSPKERLLERLDIRTDWPVWGVMRTIHVDNGPEFHSENFRNSCSLYNINIEYRPVAQPRNGGNIERVIGTIAREVHTLPGTTFASTQQRGSYKSDRQASLTLPELEKWLASYVCQTYHHTKHSALGVTPLERWRSGIFGDADQGDFGPPAIPENPTRILLDFMPAFHRQIRNTGVTIENVHYYHESLRAYIGARDPDDSKHSRRFIFRRDPRDVSRVWFYDPQTKDYYDIPCADTRLPRMSAFELRELNVSMRKRDQDPRDMHQLASAAEERRNHVERAKKTTKKERRKNERRKHHERAAATLSSEKPSLFVAPSQAPNAIEDFDDFIPLDEVE